MKKLIESWKRFLAESSLSRLYKHMSEHETAIFTGFRNDVRDISQCTDQAIQDEVPNKIRNRDIKAVLLSKGYGVTKVDGSYIEDFDTPQAVEVGEDSFFVVNLKDDTDFQGVITSLGERFCQDSVLIIPKGGTGAMLIGTNNADFPGYGQTIELGDINFGQDAEFMTKVRNRPMTFAESALLEVYRDKSRQERQAIKAIVRALKV